MSLENRTRILALVPDGASATRLASFFDRAQMVVEEARTGVEALQLLTDGEFDLAAATLPLPDMSVGRLVTEVGNLRATEAALPLVLLARDPQFEAARVFESPSVRIVRLGSAEEPLWNAIAEALGVATRLSVRIPVRLEVGIDEAPAVRFCETRNLSSSGMLISSSRPLEVGATFDFELMLPHTTQPLGGSAEVVRHSDPQFEDTTGFGARFLSLERSGDSRIQRFIHSESGSRLF